MSALEDLPLSPRARRALFHAGVTTLEELRQLEKATHKGFGGLFNIGNIGAVTVANIRAALEAYDADSRGLSVRESPESKMQRQLASALERVAGLEAENRAIRLQLVPALNRVAELETLLRHERMFNHSLHEAIELDRNVRKKAT